MSRFAARRMTRPYEKFAHANKVSQYRAEGGSAPSPKLEQGATELELTSLALDMVDALPSASSLAFLATFRMQHPELDPEELEEIFINRPASLVFPLQIAVPTGTSPEARLLAWARAAQAKSREKGIVPAITVVFRNAENEISGALLGERDVAPPGPFPELLPIQVSEELEGEYPPDLRLTMKLPSTQLAD